MKKILIINYEFPPLGGGASPVSYEIAIGYAALGHTVDVVTMGYHGLPRYERLTGPKVEGQAPYLNIYRVPCWRSRKEICHPWEQATYIFSAKRFLRKHLKTHIYDINHTHFIIPTGIVSLWLKKKYGLPYIITCHGSDVPGYNPDRFLFLHKFTGPLLRRVCDGAEKVIALSDYLKELIQENIKNYASDKLIKIPNGIDPLKFTPLKKDKIILSTGRLLPRKGFQYLIQAVSGEDAGYEVHLCGDGPMMAELKELALKSKTKIVFHGWMNNESKEYRELLGKAAIYCLVSAKENASISLLEAMGAGCAVITSNVAGCPETVGSTGLAVPPGDTIALQEALKTLTGQPDLVAALGAAARQRIEEEFAWDRIIERYISLTPKST